MNDFCPICGYQYGYNAGNVCPICGKVRLRNIPGHATIFYKKYHLNNYYRKFRVCENCGEYVPYDDVCPACYNTKMSIVIADMYQYSNPRKCNNCSYVSCSFYVCPKCGTKMDFVDSHIIGDFASGGEHIPMVEDCSEDEEILEVLDTKLYFNAFSKETRKINIICNYYEWDCSVLNAPNWMSISQGWMDGYFNITISPNMNKKERSAKIEVSCGEKKKEIVVCQYGLSINQIRSISDLLAYLKCQAKIYFHNFKTLLMQYLQAK